MDLMNKYGDWVAIIAGIAGGLIGARIHPEAARGPVNFMLYVVTGFLFAIFGAPMLAGLLGITDPRVMVGMGFFAAMLWMPIAAKVRGLIDGFQLPWPGGSK